jgi:hypothetical protein
MAKLEELKVGDHVRIIGKSIGISFNNMKRQDNCPNLNDDVITYISPGGIVNVGLFYRFYPQELEILPKFKVGDWVNTPRGVVDELINYNKPNKAQKTMNIIDFAKNLTLSSEEKLLRKVELHRIDGTPTLQLIDLLKELEAKARGYKNEEDMRAKLNFNNNLSILELDTLLKKFEKEILDIAKKYEKEMDKKCK